MSATVASTSILASSPSPNTSSAGTSVVINNNPVNNNNNNNIGNNTNNNNNSSLLSSMTNSPLLPSTSAIFLSTTTSPFSPVKSFSTFSSSSSSSSSNNNNIKNIINNNSVGGNNIVNALVCVCCQTKKRSANSTTCSKRCEWFMSGKCPQCGRVNRRNNCNSSNGKNKPHHQHFSYDDSCCGNNGNGDNCSISSNIISDGAGVSHFCSKVCASHSIHANWCPNCTVNQSVAGLSYCSEGCALMMANGAAAVSTNNMNNNINNNGGNILYDNNINNNNNYYTAANTVAVTGVKSLNPARLGSSPLSVALSSTPSSPYATSSSTDLNKNNILGGSFNNLINVNNNIISTNVNLSGNNGTAPNYPEHRLYADMTSSSLPSSKRRADNEKNPFPVLLLQNNGNLLNNNINNINNINNNSAVASESGNALDKEYSTILHLMKGINVVAVIKLAQNVNRRRQYLNYRAAVEHRMSQNGIAKYGHGGEGNERKQFTPVRYTCNYLSSGQYNERTGAVMPCSNPGCESCQILRNNFSLQHSNMLSHYCMASPDVAASWSPVNRNLHNLIAISNNNNKSIINFNSNNNTNNNNNNSNNKEEKDADGSNNNYNSYNYKNNNNKGDHKNENLSVRAVVIARAVVGSPQLMQSTEEIDQPWLLGFDSCVVSNGDMTFDGTYLFCDEAIEALYIVLIGSS